MSKKRLEFLKLTVMCAEGKLEEIKAVLGSSKPEIDEFFLLETAAEYGQLEVLEYLYSRNGFLYHSYLMVHFATRNGHLEVLKWLDAHGVNVCNQYELCIAAQHGHLEIVEWLISKGVDPHAYRNDTIHSAVIGGHLEVVKFLVETANIVQSVDELFCLAARRGHVDVMKYLASRGANINSGAGNPLYLASQNGQLEAVKDAP